MNPNPDCKLTDLSYQQLDLLNLALLVFVSDRYDKLSDEEHEAIRELDTQLMNAKITVRKNEILKSN